MNQHHLAIEITGGRWVVDVFSTRGDSGRYDLIAPEASTTLQLEEGTLYGFSYHITASAMTPFTIRLDETVLAEGVVDDSGIADGRGVL